MTKMFNSLEGRSVLVTGGTKGIGLGIARVFALAGCKVAVSGRDEATGAAAVADLGCTSTQASTGRGEKPSASPFWIETGKFTLVPLRTAMCAPMKQRREGSRGSGRSETLSRNPCSVPPS